MNPSRGHRRLVARAGDETSPPAWLGHSPLVAATHDLRTRDAHFEEAIRGSSGDRSNNRLSNNTSTANPAQR